MITLVRFGSLYLEVLDKNSVELMIVKGHRALSTSLYYIDVEELFRAIGNFLIRHYEADYAETVEDIKKERARYEEAVKARASQDKLNYYLATIKSYEERLEKLEKRKEAIKKALEVLTFD